MIKELTARMKNVQQQFHSTSADCEETANDIEQISQLLKQLDTSFESVVTYAKDVNEQSKELAQL